MTEDRKAKILENAGYGYSGNKDNLQIEVLMAILEQLEKIEYNTQH